LEPVGPVVEALGEPIPVRPVAPGEISFEVLPVSVGAQVNDLWVVGEQVRRLLDRCGPDHWAPKRVAALMIDEFGELARVLEWLRAHEVWAAVALDAEQVRRRFGGAL
jgi:hypothetical protein